MSTADTLLFLGLLALALWREDARLRLMAGITGMAGGLTSVALTPSPWIGITVLGMGIYLIVSAVRAMRSAGRSSEAHARTSEREAR